MTTTKTSLLRTALLILAVLGIMGAFVYLVARNAQWRERAKASEATAARVTVELQQSAARIQTTLATADSLRTAATQATERANTGAGRSRSLRRQLDSVAVAADSVPLLLAVVAEQDTVIAELQSAVTAHIRLDSANVAAIVALRGDLVRADSVVQGLRQVIRNAPVVQYAEPPKSFWRGVALGAIGIIAVGAVL